MKFSKYFLFLFLIIFLISCKNNKEVYDYISAPNDDYTLTDENDINTTGIINQNKDDLININKTIIKEPDTIETISDTTIYGETVDNNANEFLIEIKEKCYEYLKEKYNYEGNIDSIIIIEVLSVTDEITMFHIELSDLSEIDSLKNTITLIYKDGKIYDLDDIDDNDDFTSEEKHLIYHYPDVPWGPHRHDYVIDLDTKTKIINIKIILNYEYCHIYINSYKLPIGGDTKYKLLIYLSINVYGNYVRYALGLVENGGLRWIDSDK